MTGLKPSMAARREIERFGEKSWELVWVEEVFGDKARILGESSITHGIIPISQLSPLFPRAECIEPTAQDVKDSPAINIALVKIEHEREIAALRDQLNKAVAENAELKKENERWELLERARKQIGAPDPASLMSSVLCPKHGNFMNTDKCPKCEIEGGKYFVIPNQRPEEEGLYIAKEDAEEIKSRGEIIMPPGVSGKNAIDEKYRGVFISSLGRTWWQYDEADGVVKSKEGLDSAWVVRGKPGDISPLKYFLDNGAIRPDPNPPWLKKDPPAKEWKVGDECEVRSRNAKRWRAGVISNIFPAGTFEVKTDENGCTVHIFEKQLVSDHIRPLGRSKKTVADGLMDIIKNTPNFMSLDRSYLRMIAAEYADAREE